MADVQTNLMFYLDLRNLYAYVCVITLTYQISQKVINATFCVRHLLIIDTNQWILNYLKHICMFASIRSAISSSSLVLLLETYF